MNLGKTFVCVLRRGVSLLGLTGLLGISSLAAPVPLPEWVKPIESSLPKLPPEVISEVDEICAFLDRNAESLRNPPKIRAQWESHARRLVELQEQAGQAMIWQYLKATSGPYGHLQTLSRLGMDRDLAAWLLPIVRFRIEWVKQAIHDPEQKKYIEENFLSREIYDIENYLLLQGEFSDIENLNVVVDEAIKLNFTSGFALGIKSSGQKRLSEQVIAMHEARNRSQHQTEPYWQLSASSLIAEGVLDADALKPRPPAQNPSDGSNRPKPLGPRKPLPEIKIKTLPGFLQPWMMWPMWLFIFAVSAGLLRWVFRKPKRASDDGEPNFLEKK